MTDRWQNADWDLFAMGVDERTQREMHEHLLTQCRDCTRSYRQAVFGHGRPGLRRAPGGAFASRCRVHPTRLTASPQSIVPITTPTKQRTPWLPWLAAAACALLALWLGARLDRASHQLRRLEASSQPAHQQPPVTAPIATQPTRLPMNCAISADSASLTAERAKVRALGAELAGLRAEETLRWRNLARPGTI